jgi:hypothetical protein
MTSELGEKWYERKMEGEISVRSGPLTSRARGKFHVSATEHLQRPVAQIAKGVVMEGKPINNGHVSNVGCI